MFRSPSGRRGLAAATVLAGVACLGMASVPADSLGSAPRAWLLFAGFLALTLALALIRGRSFAPFAIALVFVVYGGVSALVAVPQSPEAAAEFATTLTKKQVKASTPAEGFDVQVNDDGFAYASLLTALAGLTAIGAALLAGRRGTQRARTANVAPWRVARAGRILVAVGFVGVTLALGRFALTQIPSQDLFASFKSFWVGGSYFLLLATFAVPGFGLWLQGMLSAGAKPLELVRIAATMALYLVLLVPTGQRGFAVALALMVLAVLVHNGRLSRRAFAALVVAGIILIGVSQAARNQIRETGTIDVGGYVTRIAPDQWQSLYGSQLTSFKWTVLVHQNRDLLEIPNPFVRTLLKPIPRQVYPDKSQGFGSEFTRRVYPDAFAQQVSFAIPLMSEADYSYGPLGIVVIFAVLGALAGFAERRLIGRAAPIVRPVAYAAIAWCVFALVRGDLANALVVSAGWILPLVLVSRGIGLRHPAKVRRVVIDALQVAPQFSGIGRRIAEIGKSIEQDTLGVPLVVRCGGDVADEMREKFPVQTTFETPLHSSRPRTLRIAYQQLIAPIFDRSSTLLVCPGDQAPIWGRAQLLFIIHDVRRVTHPDSSESRREARYYRAVLTSGARRATRILTISKFSQEEITRVLAPTAPIEVVASHPPPRRDLLAAGPDSNSLLVVGALRSYKGLETAIEALALLATDDRNSRLPTVICVGGQEGGQGYDRELANLACDRGVGDQFQLVGWVSDERLNQLYRESFGTLNPSSYEGYGLPVAESLAYGLPTIASDIPAHREVAADAALYFPAGSARGLADAISSVVDHPGLRTRLAGAALERSLQLQAASTSWGKAIQEELKRLDASREADDPGLASSAGPSAEEH